MKPLNEAGTVLTLPSPPAGTNSARRRNSPSVYTRRSGVAQSGAYTCSFTRVPWKLP